MANAASTILLSIKMFVTGLGRKMPPFLTGIGQCHEVSMLQPGDTALRYASGYIMHFDLPA